MAAAAAAGMRVREAAGGLLCGSWGGGKKQNRLEEFGGGLEFENSRFAERASWFSVSEPAEDTVVVKVGVAAWVEPTRHGDGLETDDAVKRFVNWKGGGVIGGNYLI